VCACNEVVESHSTMHPRAKVALWCIASFVSLLLAAPWHAGLSDIARSDCVGGPIYDPMSNIVRLSPFDTEHMSRHARALVTALFLWAAAAHVRDGRTAKSGWALGPLLLLQPVAWVGDSACASREVPLDNGAMFVLYPLSLYDIRGLSFVLDAPTTVGVWACLCLRTLASEEGRLVRNGTAIFLCILLMVYGSVVRRAGMPQLMCSFMLARLWAAPGAMPVPSVPELAPAASDLPRDVDQFRVTDDEEEDTDADGTDSPGLQAAGDDGVPVMDGRRMDELSRAVGGGLPQSVSDHAIREALPTRVD
jgi:hypothetical protein